jgi:ABC-type bacteriocin/lantibiotic exporter with double-glycine peptidase domain
MRLNVPYYRQEQPHTCVPACLRMVLEFFGTTITEEDLVQRCGTTLLGTGRMEMAQAAATLQLAARVVNHLSREDVELCLSQGWLLIAWIDPSLLYPGLFACSHAVVLVGLEPGSVTYHDPEAGADRIASWEQFHAAWERRQRKGVILWKP